jgi:hypothetical protein
MMRQFLPDPLTREEFAALKQLTMPWSSKLSPSKFKNG